MIDLHIHSTLSDGKAEIYDIFEEAERKKLRAIAITDHGPGHACGATNRELRKLARELKAIRNSYKVKILIGVEAEVDRAGSTNLNDDIDFDIILASIHTAASEEDYFTRLKLALTKSRIDVLAHHGLYLPRIDPQCNEELVKILKERNVAVEINSFHRLPEIDFLMMCAQAGVKYTIGSDAHSLERVGDVTWAEKISEKVFEGEKLKDENEKDENEKNENEKNENEKKKS
jgi:histidinol phosphatase-like PHP family hydrolase